MGGTIPFKEKELILLVEEDGKTTLERVEYRRAILSSGALDLKELIGKKPPIKVKTTKGKEVLAIRPYLSDYYEKVFKKGPQVIHYKDVGYILRKVALNKNMKVLEAGTGAGHLTMAMSLLAKKVISYEKEKKFYELSKRNIEAFKEFVNMDNIELRHGTIDECKEEDFDFIVLDFGNAYEFADFAFEKLSYGGFVLMYLPTMPQAIKAVENLKATGFKNIELVELIERKYKVDTIRPEHQQLVFTAYMIFARKI